MEPRALVIPKTAKHETMAITAAVITSCMMVKPDSCLKAHLAGGDSSWRTKLFISVYEELNFGQVSLKALTDSGNTTRAY